MFTEAFNKMDIFALGPKNLDILEEFFHHKYFDYFFIKKNFKQFKVAENYTRVFSFSLLSISNLVPTFPWLGVFKAGLPQAVTIQICSRAQ